MRLFQRKRNRAGNGDTESRGDRAANVAEEVAEMDETAGSSVIGPGALGFVGPRNAKSAADELRSSASPEDDTAKETFIEDERKTERDY